MNEIMGRAQELGRAIVESPEYIAMRGAEIAAMSDEIAASLIGELVMARAEVAGLLETPNPDGERLQQLDQRLTELDDKLSLLESIREWREAREAFEALVQGINEELRRILQGELEGVENPFYPGGGAGNLRQLLQ